MEDLYGVERDLNFKTILAEVREKYRELGGEQERITVIKWIREKWPILGLKGAKALMDQAVPPPVQTMPIPVKKEDTLAALELIHEHVQSALDRPSPVTAEEIERLRFALADIADQTRDVLRQAGHLP